MNLLNKLLKLFRRDWREKHADLIRRAEARGFKVVRFSDYTWGIKNTKTNLYVNLDTPANEYCLLNASFFGGKTKSIRKLMRVLEIMECCEIDDKGNR